jgi:hypothetical protein
MLPQLKDARNSSVGHIVRKGSSYAKLAMHTGGDQSPQHQQQPQTPTGLHLPLLQQQQSNMATLPMSPPSPGGINFKATHEQHAQHQQQMQQQQQGYAMQGGPLPGPPPNHPQITQQQFTWQQQMQAEEMGPLSGQGACTDK